MVLYHMNLCAQRTARHRGVSSGLYEPASCGYQSHLESRGGNCKEGRDIAI